MTSKKGSLGLGPQKKAKQQCMLFTCPALLRYAALTHTDQLNAEAKRTNENEVERIGVPRF